MAPKLKAKAAASRRRSSSASSASPKARASQRARGVASITKAANPEAALFQVPKVPVRSPEDVAAIRLQSAFRRRAAEQLANRLRDARRASEEEMEEAARALERQAMEADRRREEAEQQRIDEKKRKARERDMDIEQLVAAAFDDELDVVKALLAKGLPVDVTSRRGVTAVSEAACGGATAVVRVLLQQRANPNIRGEFGRTPLWRASYRGHEQVVPMLLDAGGDPRLANEEAERPEDVATSDQIRKMLQTWDVSRTDALLQEYNAWWEGQEREKAEIQAIAMKSVDAELDAALSERAAAQRILAHAQAERRRRICEHDEAVMERKAQRAIEWMRTVCDKADAVLFKAEADLSLAQARVDAANIRRINAAEACGAEVEDVRIASVGRPLQVRDLNDVLIRDVGSWIAQGQKWPLLVDPSDCTAKFLQYAGNSILCFWSPEDMRPDHVRRALLSMIRAGGSVVINLLFFGAGTDLQLLAEPFEEIRSGLFSMLLSREILAPNPEDPWGLPYFHSLVNKEVDGESFDLSAFADDRTAKFKFILVTSSLIPHEDLVEQFEVLRVIPNIK